MNTSLKRGYQLQLTHKKSWLITSLSENLEPWLSKAGTIMELEVAPPNSAQHQIICATDAHSLDLRPHLKILGKDSEEWSCHDMRTVKAWRCNGSDDTLCTLDPPENEEAEIIAMWYLLYPVYQSGIEEGGLPFHAALIEHNGKGVLLAASGGTGKSTCSRRIPDHWNALCDDEVFVVLDQKAHYHAHPFPTWSDYLWKRSEKTWNVQQSVPLHAVFFIHQSEEEIAELLGKGQAAVMMNEASVQTWRKYLRNVDDGFKRASHSNIFNNACNMASSIPAYKLGVSLHGRFWEEIERVLGW
jgi:SynChlorMet cassette protein ScmC